MTPSRPSSDPLSWGQVDYSGVLQARHLIASGHSVPRVEQVEVAEVEVEVDQEEKDEPLVAKTVLEAEGQMEKGADQVAAVMEKGAETIAEMTAETRIVSPSQKLALVLQRR